MRPRPNGTPPSSKPFSQGFIENPGMSPPPPPLPISPGGHAVQRFSLSLFPLSLTCPRSSQSSVESHPSPPSDSVPGLQPPPVSSKVPVPRVPRSRQLGIQSTATPTFSGRPSLRSIQTSCKCQYADVSCLGLINNIAFWWQSPEVN